MKTRIEMAAFDASAGTITFTVDIKRQGLFPILNTTRNTYIYDPSDSAKGGTLTNKVLTLTFDTAAMADSDNLQILYDDVVAFVPSSLEGLDAKLSKIADAVAVLLAYTVGPVSVSAGAYLDLRPAVGSV